MRISRKLAAVAAFFVIGAVVAGCGSSIPGNSVADVAGNPITLRAFDHWLYVAAKGQATQQAEQGGSDSIIIANDPPKFNGCIKQLREEFAQAASLPSSTLRSDCQQTFNQDASEVMNFLVEGYWFQADAHKLGMVNSAKIEASFKKALKKQFPTKASLTSYLSNSGWTKQDMLFQYRVSQLYTKLIKHYEKPVNAKAIASYYQSHKAQFATPESRNLHLIRVKTQAEAQAAINALKLGQPWSQVAKQYAEDATTKANGGLLMGLTSGQEEVAANKAIFSAPVNKLVGPIHGILGWYVFDVIKITPKTQESLAKATAVIKSTLTSNEQTTAENKALAVAKKHWLKQTTCRYPYESQTVCSNYKAPPTTTTPTATTSPTTTTQSTGTGTATTSSTGTTTSSSTTATTAKKTK